MVHFRCRAYIFPVVVNFPIDVSAFLTLKPEKSNRYIVSIVVFKYNLSLNIVSTVLYIVAKLFFLFLKMLLVISDVYVVVSTDVEIVALLTFPGQRTHST